MPPPSAAEVPPRNPRDSAQLQQISATARHVHAVREQRPRAHMNRYLLQPTHHRNSKHAPLARSETLDSRHCSCFRAPATIESAVGGSMKAQWLVGSNTAVDTEFSVFERRMRAVSGSAIVT